MQVIKVVRVASNHIRNIEECIEQKKKKSPCWAVRESVLKAHSCVRYYCRSLRHLDDGWFAPHLKASCISKSVVWLRHWTIDCVSTMSQLDVTCSPWTNMCQGLVNGTLHSRRSLQVRKITTNRLSNLLIVSLPLNINTSPTPPRALCIPSFVPAEKCPRPEVVPWEWRATP